MEEVPRVSWVELGAVLELAKEIAKRRGLDDTPDRLFEIQARCQITGHIPPALETQS